MSRRIVKIIRLTPASVLMSTSLVPCTMSTRNLGLSNSTLTTTFLPPKTPRRPWSLLHQFLASFPHVSRTARSLCLSSADMSPSQAFSQVSCTNRILRILLSASSSQLSILLSWGSKAIQPQLSRTHWTVGAIYLLRFPTFLNFLSPFQDTTFWKKPDRLQAQQKYHASCHLSPLTWNASHSNSNSRSISKASKTVFGVRLKWYVYAWEMSQCILDTLNYKFNFYPFTPFVVRTPVRSTGNMLVL